MATIMSFGGISPRVHAKAWLAPTATIIGNVAIEEGASVWFGAVLRGDDPEREIRVGAGANVQDNCVVHVSTQGPTIIGPGSTIGHGAVLESCVIGRGALVGMNAVVLPRAAVGEEALVAAAAVVASGTEIPARHLAVGTPARVKRELTEESLRRIRTGSAHYADLAAEYRASLESSTP